MTSLINTLFLDLNRVGENYDTYIHKLSSLKAHMLEVIKKKSNISNLDARYEDAWKIYVNIGDGDAIVHYPEFWKVLFEYVHKKKASIEEIDSIYNKYLDYYEVNMEMFSDFGKILMSARDHGLRVGLIANGNMDRIYRFLKFNALLPKVETITTSGGWPFSKPDRRIFNTALTQIGANSIRSVFVGDRLETDIIGANEAGLWPIHLRRTKQEPAGVRGRKRPEFTIAGLDEIWNLPLWEWPGPPDTAVIPCGGRGSRMGNITLNKQKCIIEIDGQPILSVVVKRLFEFGIKKFLFLTGYRSSDINDYMGELSKKYPICDFKMFDAKAKTTGDALQQVHGKLPDQFLYHHANIALPKKAYHQMYKAFYRNGLKSTFLATEKTIAPTHPVFKTIGKRISCIQRHPGSVRGQCKVLYSIGASLIRTDQMQSLAGATHKTSCTFEELFAEHAASVVLSRYDGNWFHLEKPDDVTLYSRDREILGR